VEHAVITGASAAGTSAASGAGKSIGGILSGVSKTLEKAQNVNAAPPTPAPASVARPSAPIPEPAAIPEPVASPDAVASPNAGKDTGKAVTPAAKASVPKAFDPSQVSLGMGDEELIEKCGLPSMMTSQTKGAGFIESYWYTTASHVPFVVTLRDGKVVSFTPPSP
jgi:hypothetical protein